MLSYYEEDQTHPLNLFQYSFLKYHYTASLLKIVLTQLSDYTGCGGGGGG
jgi:hypothetical protein